MTISDYELSNSLFQVRRDFLSHEVDGVSMSPNDVRLLNQCLFELGCNALAQAKELEHLRLKVSSHPHTRTEKIIADELSRTDTNLVLLQHPVGRREKA